MVPLLRNVVDWNTLSSLNEEDLRIPDITTSTVPLLLNSQEHHHEIVASADEAEEEDTDYSISDDEEGVLTTDDDDESLPDTPLPAGGDGNSAQLSLRGYHQRLDRGFIHKRRSVRSLRLQDAHRLGMLKRRMRDLETRNGQLKQKASTLQVKRDAVALQEQQDRERVRLLEEQLAALQQALAATH